MKKIPLSIYKYATLLSNGRVENNDDVKIYETDNSKIWLINPNEDSLNIADIELLDNKKNFVHDINGTWACLIQNKKTNNFRAISSINNELPWYYSTNKPNLLSNNIFLLAQQLPSYVINYNAIASYLSFDHTFGGETFLNHVKKVYGGDIVYLSEEGLNVVSNNLENWLGFDDTLKDSSSLMEIFIEEVDKSLNDPFPEITLTAGSDSRAILAGALKTNKKFVVMTGTAASVDKRDITIAKRIASKLKIEHKTIDASKREIGDLKEVLDRMTIETNAEFIPRNYIIFFKEYILAKETYKGVARLKGYGGEIFKGFYSDIEKTLVKKTSLLNHNIANDLQLYVSNIFQRYNDKSTENALNLFYQRERSHFWVGSNIRTSLSYCKIYNPLLSPKLLAAGYRIQGGIKNSNLHENILSTLPSSIQKIPTNYSKLQRIALYFLYKKVKKTVDYNYFLHPDFLDSNINYELLNQLIPKQKFKSMINIYASRGLYDDVLHKAFAISNFFKILES